MKKIFIVIVCLCTIINASAQAVFKPKHEISIYGGSKLDISNGDVYPDYNYSQSNSLLWSLRYSVQTEKFLAFGLYCSYSYEKIKFKDSREKRKYDYYRVIPMVKFIYLNDPVIKLYSAAGPGISYEKYDGYSEKNFAWQLTFFGLSFGEKFYGSMELGVGSLGIMNIGVGYRF